MVVVHWIIEVMSTLESLLLSGWITSQFTLPQILLELYQWDQSRDGVKRPKKERKFNAPNMILMYNAGMGRVDLADMLIALYRIKVKTRRW